MHELISFQSHRACLSLDCVSQSHWLLNLREGARTGLPGLAQFGWHHVPCPAPPHHFSLNYSLSHLQAIMWRIYFLVWEYTITVVLFPYGSVSPFPWSSCQGVSGVPAQPRVWWWVCARPAPVGLMSRGCAVLLPFSSCYLTTRISHGIWLSSVSFFPLFFLVPSWRSGAKW